MNRSGLAPVRAYPRSRGATHRWANEALAVLGLSPLARGNQGHQLVWHAGGGPIPARAGQPTTSMSSSAAARAYPRSRGATAGQGEVVCHDQGLSPLARGNLQSTRTR